MTRTPPPLLFLAVLALLAACAPPPAHAVGPFPVPEAAVYVLLSDGSRRCNAVATGPFTLYTAAHCVRRPRNAMNGATWARAWALGESEPVYVSELHKAPWADWARLSVLSPNSAWLPMRTMRRGEIVAAIVWRSEVSEWVPLVELSGEPGHFSPDVRIVYGDSGSPVIGLDGAVLGVVTTCKRKDGASECTGGGNWRPL